MKSDTSATPFPKQTLRSSHTSSRAHPSHALSRRPRHDERQAQDEPPARRGHPHQPRDEPHARMEQNHDEATRCCGEGRDTLFGALCCGMLASRWLVTARRVSPPLYPHRTEQSCLRRGLEYRTRLGLSLCPCSAHDDEAQKQSSIVHSQAGNLVLAFDISFLFSRPPPFASPWNHAHQPSLLLTLSFPAHRDATELRLSGGVQAGGDGLALAGRAGGGLLTFVVGGGGLSKTSTHTFLYISAPQRSAVASLSRYAYHRLNQPTARVYIPQGITSCEPPSREPPRVKYKRLIK
jgi:hypothetical protein